VSEATGHAQASSSHDDENVLVSKKGFLGWTLGSSAEFAADMVERATA
jgi:hypothetical protein